MILRRSASIPVLFAFLRAVSRGLPAALLLVGQTGCSAKPTPGISPTDSNWSSSKEGIAKELADMREEVGLTDSAAHIDYGLWAPKFVLEQADRFADSLPPPSQKKLMHEFKDAAKRSYLQDFFRGFVDGTPVPDIPADNDHLAEIAGSQYRQLHPEQIDQVMREFGYRFIREKGTFTSGFETMSFSPDSQPKESWWVESLRTTAQIVASSANSSRPTNKKLPYESSSIRVTIEGYLSPNCSDRKHVHGFWGGAYGHMGQYGCAFYVTKGDAE